MSTAQPQYLFVYGTLMVPEVLHAVLGRVPARLEATLEGYRRHALEGECYPAITKDPNARVHGQLLGGLSHEESATLDAYEGDAYTRTTVELAVNGQRLTADCYVWRDPALPRLSDDDWNLETFISTDLVRFLRALT